MADEKDQIDEENEDGEEGAEGEEGKKKGGKKKLLIILIPVLLLVGAAAGAYFMGLLDPLLGVEVVAEGEEGSEGKRDTKDGRDDGKKENGESDEEEVGDTAFIAIPTMIVNLNTEDGTPRYLRLTVQLELEEPDKKEAVEAVIPRVIDQFQTYLRELRVRDLRGSAGIYRLQMELLWRVNQATDPIEIKDVLFQEILIQ